jgi:hypothetical protein
VAPYRFQKSAPTISLRPFRTARPARPRAVAAVAPGG